MLIMVDEYHYSSGKYIPA